MLFCHVTSHVESDPYQDLLAEKGGRGFPHLAFLDATGEVLAVQEERSVEAFATTADRVERYLALRGRAESGTVRDRVDLLLAQIDLGRLGYDEARAALERLRGLEQFGEVVSEAEAASIDRKLVNLEFSSFLDGLDGVASRQEAIAKAAAKVLAMREASRIPDGETALSFWNVLMYHAEQQRDLALLEDAAANLKKALDPADPRGRQISRTVDQRVEKARAESKSK